MSPSRGRVADSTGNWVDGLAPEWLRPYLRLARLDRPIGSWLLLLPWAAIVLSYLWDCPQGFIEDIIKFGARP